MVLLHCGTTLTCTAYVFCPTRLALGHPSTGVASKTATTIRVWEYRSGVAFCFFCRFLVGRQEEETPPISWHRQTPDALEVTPSACFPYSATSYQSWPTRSGRFSRFSRPQAFLSSAQSVFVERPQVSLSSSSASSRAASESVLRLPISCGSEESTDNCCSSRAAPFATRCKPSTGCPCSRRTSTGHRVAGCLESLDHHSVGRRRLGRGERTVRRHAEVELGCSTTTL